MRLTTWIEAEHPSIIPLLLLRSFCRCSSSKLVLHEKETLNTTSHPDAAIIDSFLQSFHFVTSKKGLRAFINVSPAKYRQKWRFSPLPSLFFISLFLLKDTEIVQWRILRRAWWVRLPYLPTSLLCLLSLCVTSPPTFHLWHFEVLACANGEVDPFLCLRVRVCMYECMCVCVCVLGERRMVAGLLDLLHLHLLQHVLLRCWIYSNGYKLNQSGEANLELPPKERSEQSVKAEIACCWSSSAYSYIHTSRVTKLVWMIKKITLKFARLIPGFSWCGQLIYMLNFTKGAELYLSLQLLRSEVNRGFAC